MNEEKFSGKAEIYDKYRPTYPTALINAVSYTHLTLPTKLEV